MAGSILNRAIICAALLLACSCQLRASVMDLGAVEAPARPGQVDASDIPPAAVSGAPGEGWWNVIPYRGADDATAVPEPEDWFAAYLDSAILAEATLQAERRLETADAAGELAGTAGIAMPAFVKTDPLSRLSFEPPDTKPSSLSP